MVKLLLFFIALLFIFIGIVSKSTFIENKSVIFFNKINPIGRLEYFALTFILYIISYFLFFYLTPIISELPKNEIRNFYIIFSLIFFVLHCYFKLLRIKDIDNNYDSNKIYHWFLFIFLGPIILSAIAFVFGDLSYSYENPWFTNAVSVFSGLISVVLYVVFELIFLFKPAKEILKKTSK